MKLGPPARGEDIAAAERKNAFVFPPSYRAFLALHNGWLHFWPDWSLLGVSGNLTGAMRRDVRDSLRLAKDAVETDAEMDDKDPAAAWAELERQERRSPKVIHPLRHPVVGTSFNGGLLLFDRNRAHGGEPEVVAVRNGQLEGRWGSFLQLLRDARDDLRREGQAAAPRAGKSTGKTPKRAEGSRVDLAAVTKLLATRVSAARGKASQLVSASGDGTLRIWDLESRRSVRTLEGHQKSREGVFGVRVAPGGAVLASWADDRTLRLWDARSGDGLGVLATASERIRDVAFHPRDPILAAVVDDRVVAWDLRDGHPVVEIAERTTRIGQVTRTAVRFSPDGAQLVCVSTRGAVEVFQSGSGKPAGSWSAVSPSSEIYDVGNLTWSPDGALVGLSYSTCVWVKPWKGNGKPRKIEVGEAVFDYTWLPEGKSVVISAYRAVGCFTVEGKRQWFSSLTQRDGDPLSIACDSSGVVAEGSSAKVIRLRSAQSGEVASTLEGHKRPVNGVAFIES